MRAINEIEHEFNDWPDRDLPSIRAGLAEAVVAELACASGQDARWHGGGTPAVDVASLEEGGLVRRNAKSAVIREIAAVGLPTVVGRPAGGGRDIAYGNHVVVWGTATGCDPDVGARHMRRSIERELLALPATRSPMAFRIAAKGSHFQVMHG